MTKVGSILLPRLLKVAEESEKKNKSESFKNVAQGLAGLATAASGALGAYALLDEILKRRKERQLREQLMDEQYRLYLSEAAKRQSTTPMTVTHSPEMPATATGTFSAERPEYQKAAEERTKLIDEILEKAVEVKHFATPKDLVQFKKELERASETELRKIAYDIDMKYKAKQLELGTVLEKTASEAELDPLTTWLMNKF